MSTLQEGGGDACTSINGLITINDKDTYLKWIDIESEVVADILYLILIQSHQLDVAVVQPFSHCSIMQEVAGSCDVAEVAPG